MEVSNKVYEIVLLSSLKRKCRKVMKLYLPTFFDECKT